jgi:hypothetical protein
MTDVIHGRAAYDEEIRQLQAACSNLEACLPRQSVSQQLDVVANSMINLAAIAGDEIDNDHSDIIQEQQHQTKVRQPQQSVPPQTKKRNRKSKEKKTEMQLKETNDSASNIAAASAANQKKRARATEGKEEEQQAPARQRLESTPSASAHRPVARPPAGERSIIYGDAIQVPDVPRDVLPTAHSVVKTDFVRSNAWARQSVAQAQQAQQSQSEEDEGEAEANMPAGELQSAHAAQKPRRKKKARKEQDEEEYK